jgi:AcrR family transcriptional regulator
MTRTVKNPIHRRAEIVQAARQLFRTKKYDKATMQDVMESLGIAKGTIYHYFTSKEALLEAVVENIVDENIHKMQHCMNATQGTALEKIEMLVKAGNMSPENEGVLHALHQPGNEALHTRLLAATITKQARLYAILIQQGCDEGLFQTQHPLECAEFIIAAVQFLTDRGIYPWTRDDIQRRTSAFTALIEQLLRAPAGTFHFMLHHLSEQKES